jgi:hypothetical protein
VMMKLVKRIHVVPPMIQVVPHCCQGKGASSLQGYSASLTEKKNLERSTAGIWICYLLGSVCVSALPEVGVRSCVARAGLRVNAI